MFQLLEKDLLIKVDVYPREAVRGELTRRSEKEILPGIFASIVSVEESIISKLIWIRNVSYETRHDVVAILRQQRAFNRELLLSLAAEHHVADVLADIEQGLLLRPQCTRY